VLVGDRVTEQVPADRSITSQLDPKVAEASDALLEELLNDDTASGATRCGTYALVIPDVNLQGAGALIQSDGGSSDSITAQQVLGIALCRCGFSTNEMTLGRGNPQSMCLPCVK
jgi:hypothetical protein